jgi:dihydropteroate synthase
MSEARRWQLARSCWVFPRGGAVMGILNVTPDSFSDGGLHAGVDAAVEHARRMLAAEADVIDIGGESTRPGAVEVAVDEELRRVVPVVEALRAEFPSALLSVDTRHAEVARAALLAGADILNDITGLEDPAMRQVCRDLPCGIVLMHMQGEPGTMQQNPVYADVVAEVRAFFESRLALVVAEGIDPQRICLDPGIGFGKTVEHNLALIRELESLRVQNLPLLMALSRKRFMGAVLENSAVVREQVWPTLAMSLLAAERGADMHRVHDVAELRGALRLRSVLL